MNRLYSFAALGVLIAGAMLVPTAKADEVNRKTFININEPIDVQGTVLVPGRYVIKLMDPQFEPNIVQIYNADETHLITTKIAIPTYRFNTSKATDFSFYEPTPGAPMVLRTWYFEGSQEGEDFAPPPDPRHHH